MELCPSIFAIDLWLDALQGRRGLGVLIAALCLKVMPVIGLGGVATLLFKNAKSVLGK
jgi:hypothetical protein